MGRGLRAPGAICVTLLMWAFGHGVAHAQATYPVTILSEPEGATLYFDVGDEGIVETTPYSGRLPAGTYNVVVELAGHRDKILELKVGKKRRGEKVMVKLEKYDPAYLRIEVQPPDLEGVVVRIDDEVRDISEDRFELAPGTHTIEVLHKDLGPFTKLIELEAGQKKKLIAILTKNPSSGTTETPDGDLPDALIDKPAPESAGSGFGDFFVGGIGLEIGGRRFRFENPINLRPYTAGGQVLVRGYLEVSPWIHRDNKWLRQLGLVGNAAYAIPFQSAAPSAGGASADTTWFEYDLGVRAGYEFAESAVADVQLAYGAQRFSFDDGDGSALIGLDAEVPGVDYTYVRLGAGVRARLGERFGGSAGASYHLVFNTGDVEDRLGSAQTHGISGVVGASTRFFDFLDVRVVGHLGMYLIQFQGAPLDPLRTATGGNDLFFGLMVGAGYVY